MIGFINFWKGWIHPTLYFIQNILTQTVQYFDFPSALVGSILVKSILQLLYFILNVDVGFVTAIDSYQHSSIVVETFQSKGISLFLRIDSLGHLGQKRFEN